jgi:AcrR family transcriptional regulator
VAKCIKEPARERIIAAAFDVFDSVNFHKATVRDIAKKSALSPASIYKHFGSKERLVNAICDEKVKQMTVDLREHLSGIQGTLNKLRKMTWHYLRFQEQNPTVAWAVHVSTSVKTWHDSLKSRQNIQHTGRLFRDILQEGQDAGEVRRDIDIRAATYMYFGGLRFMVQLWLVRNQTYSVTTLADDFAEMIYAAIRTHEEETVQFKCPYLESLKDSAPSREKAKAAKTILSNPVSISVSKESRSRSA